LTAAGFALAATIALWVVTGMIRAEGRGPGKGAGETS
jgi:hypothetical protein